MCFFAGGDSLAIPAGVQKFIEGKKSTLKTRMDEIASKAVRDLRIGDLSLGSYATITEQKADLQTQLLRETRERLFGRNISAWGSVLSVHDELWFFPNQIRFS
jgi:RecB family exonuclease